MFASITHDVAGPGLVLALGGAALVVLTSIIIMVEFVVLLLMKWDRVWRSLLASFLMNVTSSIFGGVLAVVANGLFQSVWIFAIVSFILSVVIEAGVLMLMKRGSARQNWIAALAANLVSYLLVIIPLAAWINR